MGYMYVSVTHPLDRKQIAVDIREVALRWGYTVTFQNSQLENDRCYETVR